jgi:hypothetical protein
MENKIKFLGQTIEVDPYLNLYVDDKKIDRVDVEQLANEYKGANRIYKPISLLFWTDIKNGKRSNWIK